jgi:hypothetical protein
MAPVFFYFDTKCGKESFYNLMQLVVNFCEVLYVLFKDWRLLEHPRDKYIAFLSKNYTFFPNVKFFSVSGSASGSELPKMLDPDPHCLKC